MLHEIIAHKRDEVKHRKSHANKVTLLRTIADLPAPASFEGSLRDGQCTWPRLIAEIKQYSPSGGLLCQSFDPVAIAATYNTAGAAALSVLTDQRYFRGSLEIMSTVSKAVPLPILNKEFMVDEFQIYEARAHNADAVLLIVAILDRSQLVEYTHIAQELDLDVLVEVHTERELSTVLEYMPDTRLLGINNRDLATMTTDIETTSKLLTYIPSHDRKKLTLVSESGISSRHDVEKLAEAGINAMLVGESLLRAEHIGEKINELIKPR